MQCYSDFLRSRINHIYTVDEIDVLYRVIEDAAESHIAIDMHKIERFLRPGDLRQIGFGDNAAYDILFEIKGLRWRYDGKVYHALITPRARKHFPGVEWYVPITVCEDDGTSWSRTHMLRKEYRCRCEEGEEMTEEKHRMIGPYADFELENWRSLRKYKMCEPIAQMLEETEKRAKIQVLTESIEALVSQGYTPLEAMRFLKIPEEEHANYLEKLNSRPE